jgi:hypothetical protein
VDPPEVDLATVTPDVFALHTSETLTIVHYQVICG